MDKKISDIKFYSPNDLSVGNCLREVAKELDCFDFSSENTADINRILELHNIALYIENDCLLSEWDEETIEKYKKAVKKIRGVIGRYFSNICEDNIVDIYASINAQYFEDFWILIGKHNTLDNISDEKLEEILLKKRSTLVHILTVQNIVHKKGGIIAKFMQSSENSAQYIVRKFLIEKDERSKPIFLPKELTSEDLGSLLARYVESDQIPISYLGLIYESQSSKELPISDKTRLKAKDKYDDYWKNNSDKGKLITFGAHISFESMKHIEVEESFSNAEYTARYSKEWISENLDYPTLLNNFIYLFGYTDLKNRCGFFPSANCATEISDIISIHGVKEYRKGSAFILKHMVSSLQMGAYRQELKTNGINIESLFQWFFEEYIKEEFGVDGFFYSAPSAGTTDLERCQLLASAIDSVLKQYRMYCEDGGIDRRLFSISSGHIAFEALPSLQKKKYAYAKSNYLKNEQQMLYSDQGILTFAGESKANSDSLFALLNDNQLCVEDFARYQKPSIEWLIKRGTLICNEDNILSVNPQRAFLLEDLYNNGCVCLAYNNNYNPLVFELEGTDDIVVESTLFTQSEQNYLNFMLNKAQYSNGHDLRNKYVHGTPPPDIKQHQSDYLELLKIMVLIIIKINEEFCLKFPDKNCE